MRRTSDSILSAALFLGISFSVPLGAQEGENLAALGVATQSTTGFDLGPELALDGDFGNFTHTATGDGPAWWEVDIGEDSSLAFIVLHNRAAGTVGGSRLRDITVIVRDPGDVEVFRSELLNPENELGGGTLNGPPNLTLNLVELTGGEVTGQFVRVERTPDPDLSGTGGQGNDDEPDVLSLAEVEVVSTCPKAGDTHCEEMFITELEEGGPGDYAVEVFADDDSDGTIFYTFRAEHGVADPVVVGPQQGNIAILSLAQGGVWEISVTADDSLACPDEANDAVCSEEIDVVPPEIVNCALTGVATQSTNYQFADHPASNAIDDDTFTISHTQSNVPDAWWEVDLQQEKEIALIVIQNRGGGRVGGSRLRDITVTIRDAADTVVFESPFLNPENLLADQMLGIGPAEMALDLVTLQGAPVTGQVVRVSRTADEDFSGTGGEDGGHSDDEGYILNLAEVQIFELKEDCPEEGDTLCDSISIEGPPNDAPGLYNFTAFGFDEGGDDPLLYTFIATNGVDPIQLVGPQEDGTASFQLGEGDWTITVHVDDDSRCDDAAPAAMCSEEFQVSARCDEAGDTHCEFLAIEEPEGGGPGVYLVTANATDDRGDAIFYAFTADNGVDPPMMIPPPDDPLPREEDFASFELSVGTWQITGFADGDPLCPEEANDARCSEELVVSPADNLALLAEARQSSEFQLRTDLTSDNAVDGDPGTYTHTQRGVGPAWLEVELDQEYDIALMVFRNRSGGVAGGSRLRDVTVTIRDAGDTVVFDSGLLNQENALGGGTLIGPESIVVDPVALTGGVVRGQTVRITRTPDADFSGTGGNDGGSPGGESHVLHLAEVEIHEARDDCPAEGDTSCEDLLVTPPPNGGPGAYEVMAEGSDTDDDQPLYYTFTAQSGDDLITFGPQERNVATFQLLLEGTWTIGVTVDDDLRCADLAAGAACDPVEQNVSGNCGTAGDTHCEELIIDPPVGQRNEAGRYTITAVADDDTGDTISYLFTADDGAGAVLTAGPQAENVAEFDLGFGSWEIRVTVDDIAFCLEEAEDATCQVAIPIAEGDPDVAMTGVASQSSTLSDGGGTHSAELAIDGDRGNFTHTEAGVNLPSTWELDLLEDYEISRIVLHNRGAGTVGGSRLRDLTVSILDEAGTAVFESDLLNPENELGAVLNGPPLLLVDLFVETGNRVAGRVVRVVRTPDPDLSGSFGLGNMDEPDVLSLAEVEVYAREPVVVIPKGVGPFLRGDCDGNGTFGGSPTEAIVLLNFSFRGGPAPPCLAACDAEANGNLGITDGLRILRAAFLGIGNPDAPFPDCTRSELASDLDLGCENPFCDN